MVAAIILLGIISIIVILCLCQITLFVSYIDGKFTYTLKYLIFTIAATDKKIRKKKKSNKEKKSNKKENLKSEKSNSSGDVKHPNVRDEKKQAKKKKSSLINIKKMNLHEKITLVKDIISSSKKGLKIILKGISFNDVYIDFTISDEDAYECAIKFGKVNIAIYNLLRFLSNFFRVTKKSINIKCLFNKPNSVYNASCYVKLRLGTAILALLGIVFTFIVNNIKDNQEEKKNKKIRKEKLLVKE